MNPNKKWSRILAGVGAAGMLVGTLDPMEGSVLILAGSGLLALSMHLAGRPRRTQLYWLWTFNLIAAGVGAMFALSAVGGIGGQRGHSVWWGLLMVPYPVGWLMALAGGVGEVGRLLRSRSQRVPA